MKVSTVGIFGEFFFTLSFVFSLFVLPREWFPKLEGYIFFILLQLFLVGFFGFLSFWTSFEGARKRYFIAIAMALAISAIATAVYTWANTTFGPVRVYLFAVGVVVIGFSWSLFDQVYQAGVRRGRRRSE